MFCSSPIQLLMQYRIVTSIAFPHHSIEECKRVLHTPELWGTGPLLLLGIPPFKIYNPQNLVHINSDKCISFSILRKKMQLVSSQNASQIDIHVDNLCHIKAKIHEYNQKGHVLNLIIESNQDITSRKNIEECMKYGFWQGLEKDYTSHPMLDSFRKGV